ncbi:putative glutamine amidotransferase [Nakaseomyces bracarensis]|uniref:Glutamine amidotransferase n=1 Tax=Nakaseomyces bracarensis TaxID=273131 RepID=A0ABR4NS24_9SACH
MTVAEKKVAIFYTDHPTDWTGADNTYATMAVDLLETSKKFESYVEAEFSVGYEIFDVFHGEVPTFEQLNSGDYIGIYITGSRYDSFDTSTEWINNLRDLLHQIMTESNIPVVGICFGHQIMAHSLGASVARNKKGFEAGVTQIALNPLGHALFQSQSICLSELHFDHVETVPEGYQCWGSSSKSHVQGLYRPNKALTFQGHPEFTTAISKKSIAHQYKAKKIDDAEYQRLIAQCDSLQNDGIPVSRKIWQLYYGRI